MSSISAGPISLEILKNDGRYPGDPQLFSLWRYESPEGKTNFKCCYTEYDEQLFMNEVIHGNPYTLNVKLAWNRQGLTEIGEQSIRELEID